MLRYDEKKRPSVRVSASLVYVMPATWIDTDNECWSEPSAAGVGQAIRADGTGWLMANPTPEQSLRTNNHPESSSGMGDYQ